MSNKRTGAPGTSEDFNKEYNSMGHWMWSDIRIPKELKEFTATEKPRNSLELGCGLGRFSAYMAEQGVQATGVDFSSTAIQKARERVEDREFKPTYLVGDVTNLKMLDKQFDFAFDVGCFHCLYDEDREKYIEETYRLLKPGATLLIWTLDHSPSDMKLTPEYMNELFADKFTLAKAEASRRRIIASHWYRFEREK